LRQLNEGKRREKRNAVNEGNAVRERGEEPGSRPQEVRG